MSASVDIKLTAGQLVGLSLRPICARCPLPLAAPVWILAICQLRMTTVSDGSQHLMCFTPESKARKAEFLPGQIGQKSALKAEPAVTSAARCCAEPGSRLAGSEWWHDLLPVS